MTVFADILHSPQPCHQSAVLLNKLLSIIPVLQGFVFTAVPDALAFHNRYEDSFDAVWTFGIYCPYTHTQNIQIWSYLDSVEQYTSRYNMFPNPRDI
jgi:hypothetical protein